VRQDRDSPHAPAFPRLVLDRRCGAVRLGVSRRARPHHIERIIDQYLRSATTWLNTTQVPVGFWEYLRYGKLPPSVPCGGEDLVVVKEKSHELPQRNARTSQRAA
jgi:hypothetical protein